MFAYIRKYAGNYIKAWAIVSPHDHGWWLVEDIQIQWGGEDDWDRDDLGEAYLEPGHSGDKFTLFKPDDKRVPAKIVAEFMRRALMGES